MALVVKIPPASAGDVRDVGSILVGKMSLLPRVPWTEELGGLQSIGSPRVGYN